MGKTEKKRKENHTSKNQKTKIWDERNITHSYFTKLNLKKMGSF